MRRREILALAGGTPIAWPLIARAQQPAMPVIGILHPGSLETDSFRPQLHEGLKESGYVEGRNVAIAYRGAEGRYERLPALASELVALNVSVIVTPGAPPSVAAIRATRTIPIVFICTDPVALGLVASHARPGGNATGVVPYTNELGPKRLELLRELIPSARSVAYLLNPTHVLAASQLKDVQAAARATRFELRILEARSVGEIEKAFVSLAGQRPDALLVAADPYFTTQRAPIVALAARHAIPGIYEFPAWAAAGGLISYGPSVGELHRTVGVYVGRILKGARPADLPVQQPTRFHLVINLRTAKALGLVVPAALIERADEVIE